MSRIIHLIKTQGLGLIALMLVLTGGAAYAAASKDSVVSRSIKDGQVKTRDLKDNAVKSGKLAPDSVTSDKLAPDSVTGGKLAPDSVTGDKIPDETLSGFEIAPDSLYANDLASNSVGAAELKATHVVVSSGVGVGAGATGTATVACPIGELLTGGGHSWLNDVSSRIVYSTPVEFSDARSWSVQGFSASANTLYAWAVCLPG